VPALAARVSDNHIKGEKATRLAGD
jgi:hypothetical protein